MTARSSSELLVYFFGVRDTDAGHYVYRPGWRHGPELGIGRAVGRSIDPGFCPGTEPRPGGDPMSYRSAGPQVQGEAAYVRRGGWTGICFWDRSGADKRGGCNGQFWAKGEWAAEHLLTAARRCWPDLWVRLIAARIGDPELGADEPAWPVRISVWHDVDLHPLACAVDDADAEPAARLYAAYNRGGDPATAGRNFRGDPCPTWSALPANVREKWRAVYTFAGGDEIRDFFDAMAGR